MESMLENQLPACYFSGHKINKLLMNKIDKDPTESTSWIKTTKGKIGIAAIVSVIGAAGGAINGILGSINRPVEIKPDNSIVMKNTYKNIAVPMMSKDGKFYQMSGTYEADFNLEIISPENISERVIVKIDPEGKFEAKGKFEKEASGVEFKATTLDGKEIAFISFNEVQQYISQNPEKPKPIVGESVLNSMKGLKPTTTKTIAK